MIAKYLYYLSASARFGYYLICDQCDCWSIGIFGGGVVDGGGWRRGIA